MDFDVTFNCNGKVNINDWQLPQSSLFLRKELDNIFFPQTEYCLSHVQVKIFGNVLPAAIAIFDLRHYTKCMGMNLKILNRYEQPNCSLSKNNDSPDFYYIRRMICEFILYIRVYMNSIKWEYGTLKPINNEISDDIDILFTAIKHFTIRLKSIPDSLFHYAASSLGNKCPQAEFHLYHMHLELRWLFVTLLYLRDSFCHYNSENPLDALENTLYTVISDLIHISLKMFERVSLVDLRQKTPYSCTCVRELWLLIQILIEDVTEKRKAKPFWEHVNFCINTVLGKENSSAALCKNAELFSIWIIYHLSLLHGYNKDGTYLEFKSSRIRSNYEQVEKVLKEYLSKGGKDGERDEVDEELKIMIPMLQNLIIHWWEPRVQIISLLWDCFHKRLDEPFLLHSSGPWTICINRKSPLDILKQVKDRVDSTSIQIKESSYGLFLRLLGTFLKRNHYHTDTKYWNQIKGRVYTKFSRSKVKDFSEVGFYNFVSLFLTLGITADTVNVCSEMFNLLPPVHEFNSEDNKKSILVWKGKLAVLILYSELKLSITSIISSINDEIDKISCRKDESSRSMMLMFVDVVNIVLSSSEKLELGEYLLIGNWLERYFLECSKNKIGDLVGVFSTVVEKCTANATSKRTDGIKKMLEAIWSNVAPIVRRLIHDSPLSGNQYQEVSKLAVAFTIEALRDPSTADRYKHTSTKLFRHFAMPLMIKDIRITRYYLMLILQHQEAIHCLKNTDKDFDLILIQAWIKCSILTCDANQDEIQILEDYICKLKEINVIYSMESITRELHGSSKRILSFIMTCMKKRNSLKTEYEINQFDNRFRLYFKHLEKWILTPITDETKESKLAFFIYECIGTLILCCAPMLYVKNQPNNMLRIIINKVMLPAEQSAQLHLKTLGKKAFPMILLGMENLNVEADISLQGLIRDLFIQYLPLLVTEDASGNFKVSDTLFKCFQGAKLDFSRLMFKIISVHYFQTSGNTMHKHAYLVMQVFKSLAKGGASFPMHVLKLLITVCANYIISCFMKVYEHHPHRQQTIEFFNEIVHNSYYKEDEVLRNDIRNVMSNTVQIYLTTYPQAAFELIRSLSVVNIEIVQSIFPQIQKIVNESEEFKYSNALCLRFLWKELEAFCKHRKQQ